MAAGDPPLGGLRVSVVGAGRVGSSLASWLVGLGARLHQVAGRDGSTAAVALTQRLGGTSVALAAVGDDDLDLLLIAVSDAALETVARQLASRPQGRVALHTSGSQSATVLAPLREAGTAIGSFHPLKAFQSALADFEEARGVVFGIDGDPSARALAGRIADALGARTAEVPGEMRLLYHLGASLAAGGTVALLAWAAELQRRLRLPEVVRAGYLALAVGALRNIDPERPIAEALTGPLARGDTATFEAQLALLEREQADLAPLVRRLAVDTLSRLAELRPLTPEQQRLKGRLGGGGGPVEPP